MINLSIIWLIAGGVVILTLLYISCIQYKRANKAETIANLLADKFVEIRNDLIEASETLNENPKLKVAFEGDDEVGDFFKLLQKVGKELESSVIETSKE